MKDRKLHILCVAYGRPIHLMNICGQFLVQTSPNWELTVMYDGPIPLKVQKSMDIFNDKRIHFKSSGKRTGVWGHLNRKRMIKELKADDNDFVLLTNEDNMYVPIFVESMLNVANGNTGFVMCNVLHSYIGYDVMETKLKENYIDMGSFAIRVDIAKKIGFNHVNFSADGRYAEDCAKYCSENKIEIIHIKTPIFIHC